MSGCMPTYPGNEKWSRAERPLCLELDAGVAVYPRAVATAPRLPLLGLRDIAPGGLLRLNIDFQAAHGDHPNLAPILDVVTGYSPQDAAPNFSGA